MLPVPYSHHVVTVPHALNPLARAHPHWVYRTRLAARLQAHPSLRPAQPGRQDRANGRRPRHRMLISDRMGFAHRDPHG